MRLYFWFKGVPEDRPGGPWWHTTDEQSAYEQLHTFRPFLYAYALVDTDVVHEPMQIAPPQGAEIVYQSE